MELVLLVAVVLSAATNIFLVNKVMTTVNVTVPVPTIHVTVEAPEPVELQAVEAVEFDYTVLEAILQRLLELQIPQPLPYVIPNVPFPQYPNYPTITYGETKTGNEIEIDGVKGKQFPAR